MQGPTNAVLPVLRAALSVWHKSLSIREAMQIYVVGANQIA